MELLVFVEGLKTEEQYLVHWHRRFRGWVNVTIDEFRGGGSPLAMVKRAAAAKKAEARDARRGRGRAHDEIWCVFDRDEHPNFDEAVRLAKDNGINVAVSNPCIELWFVLHYEDQTAYIDRHDAQRRAKAHMGCGKDLTTDAIDALDERYPEAVDRAKKLDAKHAGDGSPSHSNPSTNVWHLVDVIRGERR
ncbi:RloB family protein [Phytoactinopolyspora halotolerans]|uniref:RloB domain-containing protein n=1 Tax=Phytoactinopolyspora halotolerans TaxID=1981512 RepID=A0A6L9SHI5_9ACTN|nr:RloB family protein [Phytoactinopolyspora halotolerans]NEE03781.1 RloB domain-containing protein [Phytoactinopolyspora halotolerans]